MVILLRHLLAEYDMSNQGAECSAVDASILQELPVKGGEEVPLRGGVIRGEAQGTSELRKE